MNAAPPRPARAFTLIELLVVIVIIGILAGLVMPSIKNLAHPNVMAAAARQLVDDLALARQRAITERANVYVVFFTKLSDYSTSIADTDPFLVTNKQANQLLGAQYATYALYTRRGVGDQPGVNFPRYLTEWRHLPEGTFIPATEFADTNIFNNAINGAYGNNYRNQLFPFPTTNLQLNLNLDLPWIGFDAQGRLLMAHHNTGALQTRKTDVKIRVALGSALENKNTDGTFPVADADILEAPPYTYTPGSGLPDPATRIAINWLTGRARVERTEIP
ncbi:MAG: prepilin-type N-terminal cleavage/methylation domain-containing protein [Verrucomicrobia bacterium]|nr:prepilin-type N-terminal cleavage/methylation domain-containing protein [Verrucomicrobiota bacterium]